jgi:hypothetical protein
MISNTKMSLTRMDDATVWCIVVKPSWGVRFTSRLDIERWGSTTWANVSCGKDRFYNTDGTVGLFCSSSIVSEASRVSVRLVICYISSKRGNRLNCSWTQKTLLLIGWLTSKTFRSIIVQRLVRLLEICGVELKASFRLLQFQDAFKQGVC